jgi:hypothetical protein
MAIVGVTGATGAHRECIVVALGITPADALECYRALSWTVTGFVMMEQSLERSAHHRRAGPTRWVLEVDGDVPSTFDTEELFRTTLALALDGLDRRASRSLELAVTRMASSIHGS